MKIKSYKDGNEVKKYVSTGKEKKAFAGAVIGGIGAVANIVSGASDYRRGKREAEDRRAEIANLKATAPSLETPAAFRQAVKDSYDRSLLELQQKEINRQLGTAVGSLQQAGGRALLGGIGAATQQAALSGQAAAQQQAKTQFDALKQLGRAELASQQMREERYQKELAAQREALQAAEAGAGAGLGTAIQGAVGGVGLLGATTGLFGKSVQKAMLSDFTKGDGTSENAFIPKKFSESLNLKVPKIGEFKKGGVTKTNGEFSHEKNPIDLVQNGEKVGEATGGEYIFNPQQSKKMSELAKKATEGGSEREKATARERLAKFVRRTLKRFEKDLG